MEAPGGPIRDADDKPMEPGPTICIKAGWDPIPWDLKLLPGDSSRDLFVP